MNNRALWKRRIKKGGVLNLRIARRKDQKCSLFGLTGPQQNLWFRLLIEMISLTLEKNFLVLSF